MDHLVGSNRRFNKQFMNQQENVALALAGKLASVSKAVSLVTRSISIRGFFAVEKILTCRLKPALHLLVLHLKQKH
jgi:hypothetical protein